MTKRNKAARQRWRQQKEEAAAKALFPTVTTGLLNRQFASITDTLAKASRRREEELQVRKSMPLKAASTMHATTFRDELPATHEPDAYLSSESDDSGMGLNQVQEGSEDTASNGPSEATLTATASGNADVQVFLPGGYDSDDAEDPRKMLAELEKAKKYPDRNNEEENEDRYLAQLLAEMGSSASPVKTSHIVDDPKEMLEEINQLSSTAKHPGNHPNEIDSLDDPKVMLADIGRMKQASDQEPVEDDDLETLRGRLATMLLSSSLPAFVTGDADTTSQTQTQPAKVNMLEPEVLPHVLALMMESGGYKWEEVDGWCKYLFSSAADAHRDKQESEQMVKSENEKLDATIAYVIEEENKYRAIDEKKRLLCRLIVSNLAAGVDEEAIRIFFSEYKWDMRDVIILPERDPVKRTQTAYIDMYSRKTAVRASFDTGGIFGLAVKIKLAVE